MAKLDLPNAGDLRFKVVYQTRDPGKTPLGKDSGGWSDRYTLRASYRQIGGRESAVADRLKVVAVAIIETRHFPGADARGRLLMGSRAFNIVDVDDVGGLGVWYRFTVEEWRNPPP